LSGNGSRRVDGSIIQGLTLRVSKFFSDVYSRQERCNDRENQNKQERITMHTKARLIEFTRFFMVRVFFAVTAIFHEVNFFRSINFIAHGDVIGGFADRAYHSDKEPLFFLCHMHDIIPYYRESAKRELMNKEQLVPLLWKDRQWFQAPTCVAAEELWAHFFEQAMVSEHVLRPTPGLMYTAGFGQYDVSYVEKFLFGQPTRLVIDPFPGIIMSHENCIYRPLVSKPRIPDFTATVLQRFFHDHLQIPKLDVDWYMHGMRNVLNQTVEGGIDGEEFIETLTTFQYMVDGRKTK
jgi:hypothetical protein